MKSRLAALASGLVFGLGLTVSQMIDPAKVLGFFDVAGAWDPSLGLVMAGALFVTLAGYRLVLRRKEPLFDARFHLPVKRRIEASLIGGAALFGIGWGLTGFCPAPAVAALGLGYAGLFAFVVSMIAGMILYRGFRDRMERAVAHGPRGRAVLGSRSG